MKIHVFTNQLRKIILLNSASHKKYTKEKGLYKNMLII